MNKKLSWKVLLLIGAVCWVLSHFLGDIIGGALGVLATILIVLGVVNLITELVKNKDKTKV